MAFQPGWKGRIEVSGDGKRSWFELEAVEEASLEDNTEFESILVWENRGYPSSELTTRGVTLSVQIVRDAQAAGQNILASANDKSGKFHCRFYPNRENRDQYMDFRATTNFSQSFPGAEVIKGSFDINSDGRIDVVGIG